MTIPTSNENMEKKKASATSISTYKMKPPLSQTFKANAIKQIIQKTLSEKLQGKNYVAEEVAKWTRDISDTISAAVKEQVPMPRYKHVVQVIIGQQMGAGCRYIAKCCWDAESDAQTSDIFTSANLFCVCTVFGVYLY